MKLRFYFSLAFAVLSCVISCANRPDPKKEFQIGINGESYLWEPGTAVAYLEGFSLYDTSASMGISLVFPQQSPSPMTTKGLFIRFSSTIAVPGQEVHDGPPDRRIDIIYSPAHPMAEGGSTVNEFSTGFGDGTVDIVFDAFEKRLNGEIRGKLKYAKLYGYMMLIESGERIPPKKPVVLELYNWPFDLRLEQSRYYQ
jgi:hypothetical protein